MVFRFAQHGRKCSLNCQIDLNMLSPERIVTVYRPYCVWIFQGFPRALAASQAHLALALNNTGFPLKALEGLSYRRTQRR